MPNVQDAGGFAVFGLLNGGLDMAVRAVTRAELAWVSDIDPGACKILAHHYPAVPNLGDITAVDWATVEPVDILTGGFPCQDVSQAGRRSGMRIGTRSGLWALMADAIDQLRPSLVVIENVKGLLSADGHPDVEPCAWCLDHIDPKHVLRALGVVLGDLADLGFDAAWHGLSADSIGAVHDRYRVFIVAWPTDTEPRGIGRDRRRVGPSDSPLEWSPREADGLGQGNAAASDTDGPGFPGRELPCGMGSKVSTLDSRVDPLPDAFFDIYAPTVRRWERVTRPAPIPVVRNRNGRPQLNLAFDEWMMGLPGGHITGVPGIGRKAALRALGNGVVPQQAEHALRYLLDAVAVAA